MARTLKLPELLFHGRQQPDAGQFGEIIMKLQVKILQAVPSWS